jgi:hypothetical protein
VWRGNNPHDHGRVTFSHAAWWIASEQGTRIFALDDHAVWKPAFDALLAAIVDSKIVAFSVYRSPSQRLSADLFDNMLVDYPAHALDQFRWPGDSSFIRTDLLNSEGDQYFLRSQDEPTHRGLQVSSTDLLKMFAERRAGPADRLDQFESRLDQIAADILKKASQKIPSVGGRPHNQALYIPEVCKQLKSGGPIPRKKIVFARDIHNWLKEHPKVHVSPKETVEDPETIGKHIAPLWEVWEAHRILKT